MSMKRERAGPVKIGLFTVLYRSPRAEIDGKVPIDELMHDGGRCVKSGAPAASSTWGQS